jgi:hypothetical protein
MESAEFPKNKKQQWKRGMNPPSTDGIIKESM